jgi:hypothetical protein
MGDLFGDCCLGDPCTLKDQLCPCSPWDIGGWTQLGYHSGTTRMSFNPGDLYSFNDVPNGIRLQQAWVYAEKKANARGCCADWGMRADIMYGTDAQKTQAFGNPPGNWDYENGFDHGSYGWAIPQLYGEVAYGDWSVIAGHFFTIVGYETIPAPQNFFYSHSYTMFNSEPFTHTGALATYSNCGTDVYLGWTLGWDSGFDQYFSGSNFLGGFSTDVMDDVKLSYVTTIGNFGWRSAGTDGYSHSIVLDATLTNRLTYVLQSDYYVSDGSNGDVTQKREDIGINQYLFYTLNDCWAVGGRAEWWKSKGYFGPGPAPQNHQSYYEITGGINYRPHANIIFRPEVRYNWTPADAIFAPGGFNQVVFGVDCVATF